MGATALRLVSFAGLLALLAANATATFLPLSDYRVAFHVSVALAQALLIYIVFMGLHNSPPLVRIIAGAATVWLLILFGFIFLDYAHRQPSPAAPTEGWREQPPSAPARFPVGPGPRTTGERAGRAPP